jgi:hypothetical protein
VKIGKTGFPRSWVLIRTPESWSKIVPKTHLQLSILKTWPRSAQELPIGYNAIVSLDKMSRASVKGQHGRGWYWLNSSFNISMRDT